METIFGNSMATGNFAKDSSAPLGRDDNDVDSQEAEDTGYDASEGTTQGATSTASRPSKRAKLAEIEEEGLIGAVKSVGKDLANAIQMVAHPDDLPPDLFPMLQSMPGFNSAHISYYFHYLVANPSIGRAFYALPWENKLDWVSMYIAEKFPGQ